MDENDLDDHRMQREEGERKNFFGFCREIVRIRFNGVQTKFKFVNFFLLLLTNRNFLKFIRRWPFISLVNEIIKNKKNPWQTDDKKRRNKKKECQRMLFICRVTDLGSGKFSEIGFRITARFSSLPTSINPRDHPCEPSFRTPIPITLLSRTHVVPMTSAHVTIMFLEIFLNFSVVFLSYCSLFFFFFCITYFIP